MGDYHSPWLDELGIPWTSPVIVKWCDRFRFQDEFQDCFNQLGYLRRPNSGFLWISHERSASLLVESTLSLAPSRLFLGQFFVTPAGRSRCSPLAKPYVFTVFGNQLGDESHRTCENHDLSVNHLIIELNGPIAAVWCKAAAHYGKSWRKNQQLWIRWMTVFFTAGELRFFIAPDITRDRVS